MYLKIITKGAGAATSTLILILSIVSRLSVSDLMIIANPMLGLVASLSHCCASISMCPCGADSGGDGGIRNPFSLGRL